MTEHPLDDEGTPPPELHLVPRDTSFEHALDETAPKPEPVHDGDGIEIPRLGGERKPIVPEHLRTWPGIQSTGWQVPRRRRVPRLVPRAALARSTWSSACSGHRRRAPRSPGSSVDWWWVAEQSSLRSKAVVDGNSPEWRALHGLVAQDAVAGAARCSAPRRSRSCSRSCSIAALAPWWAWLIVAAVAMPPLAHYGQARRTGRSCQSAVTTPLVRKISTDAIVRAYERAGLCSTDPKKPADHLGFGSTMSRDALDKGSQVVVYLPYGGTFAQVVNAKTQIASGLDVAESRRSISPGQAVRAASHAARPRHRPAGRARRAHAAARLQAAAHLAQGPVRARPVRPQGRVLPACGSRC